VTTQSNTQIPQRPKRSLLYQQILGSLLRFHNRKSSLFRKSKWSKGKDRSWLGPWWFVPDGRCGEWQEEGKFVLEWIAEFVLGKLIFALLFSCRLFRLLQHILSECLLTKCIRTLRREDANCSGRETFRNYTSVRISSRKCSGLNKIPLSAFHSSTLAMIPGFLVFLTVWPRISLYHAHRLRIDWIQMRNIPRALCTSDAVEASYKNG